MIRVFTFNTLQGVDHDYPPSTQKETEIQTGLNLLSVTAGL